MQQMTEKENSLILYLFYSKNDKRSIWQLDSVLQYSIALGWLLRPPADTDGCPGAQQWWFILVEVTALLAPTPLAEPQSRVFSDKGRCCDLTVFNFQCYLVLQGNCHCGKPRQFMSTKHKRNKQTGLAHLFLCGLWKPRVSTHAMNIPSCPDASQTSREQTKSR